MTCPSEMAWEARLDLVKTVQSAAPGQTIREVIVDLKNLTFINSAGIGAMFTLRKYVASNDGGMVICNVNPSIQRLFDTVNLPALIPIVDDVETAIEHFDSKGSA